MRWRRKDRALEACSRANVKIFRARLDREHAIREARAAGATWREIGDTLGMSPSGVASLVSTKPENTHTPPSSEEAREAERVLRETLREGQS